ncbi:MAG: phosphoesterase [Pseudarthrobacter sp.]|nr:phosphoesterase [Pseudarthrobacter sp.]
MSRSPAGTRGAVTRLLPVLALLLSLLTACQPAATVTGKPTQTGSGDEAQATPHPGRTPGHVFVINLENKGFDAAWGANSPAPYLSGTLRKQGVLLENYYGIAHNSLPNYLAQISGQPPNPSTKQDCHTYTEFVPGSRDDLGRYAGDGCVFPADVPTVAGQLTAAGKTWKGYMEDMQHPCQHPSLGSPDTHVNATVGNQYATKHNPFVYFRSITSTSACSRNDVPFTDLARDLASADTTPNLAYITPNLCHDGHDHPCVDGAPGGLPTSDEWLSAEVPAILASPAYRQDGMLVITFDESDGGTTGPEEGTPGSVPGGTGGGRIGSLVLTPFSTPGATSVQPYNHYSLLASIEDYFSLPRLGGARDPGVTAFGEDVYRGSQG